MPTEAILRMRITDAVREADIANANRDQRAYDRAKAKYDLANEWLTRLEKKRNEQAICELEAKARDGKLGYGRIQKAGVPFEVLRARGWVDIPGATGMRKVDKSAGEQAGEVERHDDTAEPDRKDAEHDSGGECA
jgi:hypothetical protein